ncbi:Uncharacterized protein A9P81_2393 [Leptospira interrogans serovar Copenhageni/Icterohaemorrhagiae]|nr:Uncharacterized protein A9P81_2393 [Leptospira interrogans serovar Copenhageni/Icterohaemorrhagiae]
MKFRLIAVILFLAFLQCVTYRDFPKDYIGKAPQSKSSNKILYYKIYNGTIAGGSNRLNDVIQFDSPFSQTVKSDTLPEKGLYLKITIEQRLPNIASFIFGYISFVTLTIFPFWSNEDGSNVLFQIYQDGQFLKSYEYRVRRSGFVWILMAPFAWVNAFTYSESEAFEAIAFKFFEDSAPDLLNKK